MLYTVTTPECVKSTYHEVGDTEKFITSLKEEHPNVELAKGDLWTLDWTPTGYARNQYIILKRVTDEDLEIMRKILKPNFQIFHIRTHKIDVTGYIDTENQEIYLSDEYRKLQNLRDYYSEDRTLQSLSRLLWVYRTNLKTLVLEKNWETFHYADLTDWGVKDPKIDVEYEVLKSNIPANIKSNPEKLIITFKDKVFVDCNYMVIKTKQIIEDEKFIIFDNAKIIKDMVNKLYIMGDD